MANPKLVSGSNEFELSLPHKVSTEITLSFDMISMDDGTTEIYDNGVAYDKRITRASFFFTPDEQEELNDFIYNIARGQSVILEPQVSGFFPFAPDAGQAGEFTVTVIHASTPRIHLNPFRYFECELIITNVGDIPTYRPIIEVDDGLFDFGSVVNLHYPQTGFKPDQEYAVSVTHSESSNPYYFDRGSSIDNVTTKYSQECNVSKACALLHYLTDTIRTDNILFYENSYYYIFGADHQSGAGPYNARLNTNKIIVTQKQYDDWKVEMYLKKVEV